MDDMEVLVKRAKVGDEEAFRQIIDTYKIDVLKIIIPSVRNQKDAEELAQDVFVRVYYALPQFEERGFKTWLTKIAVNMAIDHKRKLTRRKEEELDNIDVATNELEEKYMQKETKRILYEKLETVPDNYRHVLVAFYLEEKSYQEIAREQSVEVKTVETKLYRARKWVKERWKE